MKDQKYLINNGTNPTEETNQNFVKFAGSGEEIRLKYSFPWAVESVTAFGRWPQIYQSAKDYLPFKKNLDNITLYGRRKVVYLVV